MANTEKDVTHSHQPGQAVFRSILPEDINWQPLPAFPPAVRLAVLVGHPSELGPYVMRVKAPDGTKLMPHKHPEDRIYTVMSGVFYIGLGDQFDGDKVKAFLPGSVIGLPGGTSHFHWAKSGEYATQITAIGPLGLEYLNPTDDPRMLTPIHTQQGGVHGRFTSRSHQGFWGRRRNARHRRADRQRACPDERVGGSCPDIARTTFSRSDTNPR